MNVAQMRVAKPDQRLASTRTAADVGEDVLPEDVTRVALAPVFTAPPLGVPVFVAIGLKRGTTSVKRLPLALTTVVTESVA